MSLEDVRADLASEDAEARREAVIALGLIWAVVRRLVRAEPLPRRIGAVPSAQVVADSA